MSEYEVEITDEMADVLASPPKANSAFKAAASNYQRGRTMTEEELCQWLRDNSSGVYRPAAIAAYKIEELRQQIVELKRVGSELADELQTKRNSQRSRIFCMKWYKVLQES